LSVLDISVDKVVETNHIPRVILSEAKNPKYW